MKQQILWNTATVEDRMLTVYLSTPPDQDPGGWKTWSTAFGRVLGGGEKPGFAVELIRGAIQVPGADDADAIAERLDELVAQANEEFEHVGDFQRRIAQRREELAKEDADRDEELQRRFRQRGDS